MDIRKQLEEVKERTEGELHCMRTEEPTFESIYRHLKNFIVGRFLIDDGYFDDSIAKLAEHSIDLAISKAEASEERGESLKDLSLSCSGASSSETKRALLYITLRKSLDLDMPPSMVATHDTVPLLAEEIARQLAARRSEEHPEKHSETCC